MKTDVSIIHEPRSVSVVSALTPRAVRWILDEVQVGEAFDARYFPCENRYIENLAKGMLENGLKVEVNGHRVTVGENGSVVLTV